ncbi:hypothetical protein JJB11_03780 [Ramlibacter ginsenosidimutans]|uniref:Uncharacterized protein n=1 Tax=Ramlibacter ginsenosidimutans TaxID=502333 RepID=A0A934TPP0_9BURK|nr:hypothetical protein [Ramlibacter ginsenosidimutans]MBK6005202.1 hypothetical protein [Ramlibacter ginsenosidimutans]
MTRSRRSSTVCLSALLVAIAGVGAAPVAVAAEAAKTPASAPSNPCAAGKAEKAAYPCGAATKKRAANPCGPANPCGAKRKPKSGEAS